MFEIVFLFIAGFLGGILNSVAGGGSFITFPALIFMGIPPVSANATNTFASSAGYFSGTFALRHELIEHKAKLPKILLLSLLGGLAGAYLLLHTSDAVFRKAVPWLLLFATVMFIWGGDVNRWLRQMASHHKHASALGAALLSALLLGVSTYGGFFNAGLGIISLSYLALAGYTNINAMNGIKLLISSAVSVIAVVLFIWDGVIAWYAGTLVLLGTLTGGYFAAHLSRRLPQKGVRAFVIVASIATTFYFFYDVYWRPAIN